MPGIRARTLDEFHGGYRASALAVAARKPTLWNEIELIDEVGKILNAYNNVAFPNNRAEHIAYMAAYPDYIFDYTGSADLGNRPRKLVCYDITKKDSGSLGKSKYDRTKRQRPILMESQTPVLVDAGTPDERNVVQDVYMKHYDITLRFDCLAPSDRESMELIRTVEKVLEAHALYLERGAQRFIYDGRTPSYFNRDTKYKSRTCLFFAQVQEKWFTIEDYIETINVNYLMASGQTAFSTHVTGQSDIVEELT